MQDAMVIEYQGLAHFHLGPEFHGMALEDSFPFPDGAVEQLDGGPSARVEGQSVVGVPPHHRELAVEGMMGEDGLWDQRSEGHVRAPRRMRLNRHLR